VTLNAT